MEKEKVLVFDDKGLFLEMFKKDLINEFKFSECSFLKTNHIEEKKDFDAFVFVVYNKLELIEFLKLEKQRRNVLVCLFDEKLYGNISFLEEINNLIMLDGYKTKSACIRDLKEHLKKTPKSKEQFQDHKTQNIGHQQAHRFFKTILLFI
ncbi:hypothetical protein [Flavobacterium sp. JAS]|uniref:hypothetical protein n=1 Tax=Flavobacterium sp. JAS TaxID=2897329 RepID=UPI001E307603|nr:hypothetical protein [Flavobacterium sp. JAS]MCD0471833.1 hypothetical protein [Flavobacterium sp. JAS]